MRGSRRASGLAAVALIATALLARETSGYIRVQNGLFVDEECKEFMFSGYNAWETIEASLNLCCGDMVGLQKQFKEAVRQNFNVIRIFGFPVQKGFNLQTRPGVYNEQAFKGLDNVIAEAGRAGLKLIIALTNNWNYNTLQTDWKCSYTNWTTSARGCDDFFTDRQAIMMYKNHAQKILTRINTVTGIPYSNDSTIFGYDLMNEPRSAKDSGIQDIQSWITEVAPFVKSLAGHQLITVGEDGFYGPTTCQAWNGASPFLKNGQDQWPLHTGQDFLPNHMVDGIDFASLHLWPDNWARTDEYFGRKWLDTHLKDQWYMGKPVVIEEFGKALGMKGGWMAQTDQTYQDQYNWFKLVYGYAQQSLSSDYGYKGIMFWRWASVDPTAGTEGFDGAATISTNSTIFADIIEPYSQKLMTWLRDSKRKPIAKCTLLSGNTTQDLPAPAPAPSALDLLLGGASAPAPMLAAGIVPTNVPALAPIAVPGDMAHAPISAPTNLTPGTLVNAEPGNPIVASVGPPIAAPAKIPAAQPGTPAVPVVAPGVPVVAPGAVAVVNAPAGGPVNPVQQPIVPGTVTATAPGAPAVAPAAYVWAGANTTGPGATAGRKLMQTKENVVAHASRVADAPLSVEVLAPLLAPAESPLAARGPAVVAAVAAAATAPALGPSSIVVSQPMSSVLSITAPMAAEATVISDLQEEPYAATMGPAFTGPVDGARRAGINDFQQRGGPGGGGPGGGGPGGGGPGRPGPGGPGDGPPQLPGPMMPGPGDDSASSNTAAPTAAPAQSSGNQQSGSQQNFGSQQQSGSQQSGPVIEPFSATNFKTESTFSTPDGINANNINAKVTCT